MEIVLYSLIGGVILLIIIGLAVANFAFENLVTVYRKFAKYQIDFYSCFQFANQVSHGEFNGQIQVQVVEGFLTDHYHNGVISLSQGVVNSANVASLAVVAHELGHAMQYRDTPEKMQKWHKKQAMSSFFAKITLPLFLGAVVALFFDTYIAIGILGAVVLSFILGLVSKISTIKIEWEASLNALKLLEKYVGFDDQQLKQAKKVLSCAKLTYVASFLKTMLKWTMLVRKYDFM